MWGVPVSIFPPKIEPGNRLKITVAHRNREQIREFGDFSVQFIEPGRRFISSVLHFYESEVGRALRAIGVHCADWLCFKQHLYTIHCRAFFARPHSSNAATTNPLENTGTKFCGLPVSNVTAIPKYAAITNAIG